MSPGKRWLIIAWMVIWVVLLTGAPVSQAASSRALLPSLADLVDSLSTAVVNISTTSTIRTGAMGPGSLYHFFGNDEFFRRFFGDIPEREIKQRSLGSGFIITPDGYIFTNNHVVAKAEKIKVKLRNGREYDAEVKGRDPNTDLALIKINTETDLPCVRLGDSDALRVGDWVFAIGNPFGLESTVTVGIVSAKGRVIGAGPYDDFIQTDASINPGNSGGPLFNLQGEVVGINTAIVAQGQGIGFSVPINMAKAILEDLKTKGRVTRGWLGVSIQEITPEMAKSLKLKDTKGALIGQVFEGDPADKAGIKTGDVIVAIDGRAVADSHELLRVVAGLPVGKRVTVTVIRDGEEKKLEVIVGQRRDDVELARGDRVGDELGLTVREVTPELARRLGLPRTEGVVVTGVKRGSPAEEAGIKVQDVILQINRVKIRSLSDLSEELKTSPRDMPLLLLIKREEGTMFVTIRRGEN